MATPGLYRWKKPFLRLQVLEWAAVLILIVVLALVFTYKVHVVRGQAELAGVHATLGALRTAFVIDWLHSNLPGNAATAVTHTNPFKLLERFPANYFGEISADNAATLPGGNWAFDPVCVCVGYRPIYPEWFDSPSGDDMAWYQVERVPGPPKLMAKEAYRWQGQAMN